MAKSNVNLPFVPNGGQLVTLCTVSSGTSQRHTIIFNSNLTKTHSEIENRARLITDVPTIIHMVQYYAGP